MGVLAISRPLHSGNNHNLFAFVKCDQKSFFSPLLLLIHYATRLQHNLSSKKTGEESSRTLGEQNSPRRRQPRRRHSRLSVCALPALFSLVLWSQRHWGGGMKRCNCERHRGCSTLIRSGRLTASCRRSVLLFLHCLANSKPDRGKKKKTSQSGSMDGEPRIPQHSS